MKKRICSVPITALLLLLAAPVAQAQSPVGYWRTIDDETGEARSIVQIYEQDGALYGKIVKVLKVSEEAKRNEEGQVICTTCEGERHNQPVEGMVFIKGLEKDGDTYEDGTIFNPEDGKTYKAKMKVNDDGDLDVRGYVGISLFGKSQTWEPAEKPAEAPSDA